MRHANGMRYALGIAMVAAIAMLAEGIFAQTAPIRMPLPIRIAWTKAGPSSPRGVNGARRSGSTSIATARASGYLTAAPPRMIAPAQTSRRFRNSTPPATFVASFGAGLFNYPHGFFVDSRRQYMGVPTGGQRTAEVKRS